MLLADLASQLIQIRAAGATPVLQSAPELSLRSGFVIATVQQLVLQLPDQQDRQNTIRIDWVPRSHGVWSVVTDQLAQLRARRLTTQLRAEVDADVQMHVTATIGRPGNGLQDAFVLGMSEMTTEIPAWTHPIKLVGSQPSAIDLQLSVG